MSITVDLWQTFEGTAITQAQLEANDNCADGTWAVTDASSKLSRSATGEFATLEAINTVADTGTYGLAVDVNALNAAAYIDYIPASDKTDVSIGFWFKAPAAQIGTYNENDLLVVKSVTAQEGLYVKVANENADNLFVYLYNTTDLYSASYVTIAGDTWYWCTVRTTKNGTNYLRIYNASGTQVGSEVSSPERFNENFHRFIFGSFIGIDHTNAGVYYLDDIILDWANATFPLGPGSPSVAITGTATASITEADIVTGGKTIIATVTGDTYVPNTQTQPVIETADCTVSGSNTAGSSWAVSHPNAATGDLLIFYIAWDDSTATTDCAAPAGPNSETLTAVTNTPLADYVDGTIIDSRAKAWWTVATGAWTAGTIAFTPNATESWSATVVRVPVTEFDSATPIGATATAVSAAATDTNVLSPAFSAGSSDGDGTLLWFAGVDTDPLSATPPTNWAILQRQDLGAVAHGVARRTAAVTDSENIAAASWAIAGDSWTSIAVIVRAPVATPFENARQAIINGIDSAQSEGTGWDAEVKAKLAVTTVVRTSATIVTVTLSAQAAYNITAQETITVTMPATALVGAGALVGTPTFTVDASGGAPALKRFLSILGTGT
jgi:hypothetical protein